MNCPKCEADTLGEFSVQGVAVDRCSSCAGIWFDAHELSQLLAEEARHVASLRRGHVKDEVEGKRENVRAMGRNSCVFIAASSGRSF